MNQTEKNRAKRERKRAATRLAAVKIVAGGDVFNFLFCRSDTRPRPGGSVKDRPGTRRVSIRLHEVA